MDSFFFYKFDVAPKACRPLFVNNMDLIHFMRSFHIECPVLSYFVTFQLRPFHAECPDPGRGTKICVKIGVRVRQLINIHCLECIVDF